MRTFLKLFIYPALLVLGLIVQYILDLFRSPEKKQERENTDLNTFANFKLPSVEEKPSSPVHPPKPLAPPKHATKKVENRDPIETQKRVIIAIMFIFIVLPSLISLLYPDLFAVRNWNESDKEQEKEELEKLKKKLLQEALEKAKLPTGKPQDIELNLPNKNKESETTVPQEEELPPTPSQEQAEGESSGIIPERKESDTTAPQTTEASQGEQPAEEVQSGTANSATAEKSEQEGWSPFKWLASQVIGEDAQRDAEKQKGGGGRLASLPAGGSPPSKVKQVEKKEGSLAQLDRRQTMGPPVPPVRVRDVRIEEGDSGEKTIVGFLQNTSSMTLRDTNFRVEFLNKKGKKIHEKKIKPLVIQGGIFGDKVATVKPSMMWQFALDTAGVPSSWAGEVEILVESFELEPVEAK